MGIELSTQLIHASIAQVLHEIVPEAEIFDNPNQQGTPYPAWFIVHRSPVEIRREIRRYYITYYIDVWYMIQQNITQMFDKYTAVAEQLADKMEYIPLYGYPGVVLHTFETSWSLEMTAMKYSLTLRLVCSRDGAVMPKMEVIEDFQTFIKGLGKLKRIRYICSQFPDFDMGLETLQYCTEGNTLVLPFVSGIYRDGDNTRWEPLTWNVGPFGGQYGPITDDVTIDLVMGVVVGFDVCIGGTVGVGSNLGSDIVWRLTDMSKDAWHYVGPELVLGDVIVIGGDDLSRDAYEYVGPQKNLGPSPVLGGTVEPYNPTVELPTVSVTGDFGVDNELYLYGGGMGLSVPISAGETSDATLNGTTKVTYDNGKSYGVVYWFTGTPGRTDIALISNNGNLAFKNITNQRFYTRDATVAVCSSNQATVVTVYDFSDETYNAFKFTEYNTDYYYVLDGTQTDWTDDLSSIGYSLGLTAYLDTAHSPTTLSGSSYLYAPGSRFYLKGDQSKTYTIIALYSSESGEAFTDSRVTLSVSGGYLRLYDMTYSYIVIQRVEYTVS